MTKFNTLPLLSAQLTRLAADSGFTANLDTEVPEGWETSCLVTEGILHSLQGQTVASRLTMRQTAALRPYLYEVDTGQPIADALFDAPDLCVVIYDSRGLFTAEFRTACKYINEIAECAFEGSIAETIGLC